MNEINEPKNDRPSSIQKLSSTRYKPKMILISIGHWELWQTELLQVKRENKIQKTTFGHLNAWWTWIRAGQIGQTRGGVQKCIGEFVRRCCTGYIIGKADLCEWNDGEINGVKVRPIFLCLNKEQGRDENEHDTAVEKVVKTDGPLRYKFFIRQSQCSIHRHDQVG